MTSGSVFGECCKQENIVEAGSSCELQLSVVSVHHICSVPSLVFSSLHFSLEHIRGLVSSFPTAVIRTSAKNSLQRRLACGREYVHHGQEDKAERDLVQK